MKRVLESKLTIVNERGLHARAAAKFVQLAGKFESRVTVCNGEEEADGKSILSLMVLGAGRGTELLLRTQGADEEAACKALTELVEGGFDEGS